MCDKRLDFGGEMDHDSHTGIFLKEFLPSWNRGSCTNFDENSRSCRQTVMKFIAG